LIKDEEGNPCRFAIREEARDFILETRLTAVVIQKVGELKK